MSILLMQTLAGSAKAPCEAKPHKLHVKCSDMLRLSGFTWLHMASRILLYTPCQTGTGPVEVMFALSGVQLAGTMCPMCASRNNLAVNRPGRRQGVQTMASIMSGSEHSAQYLKQTHISE